MACKDIFKAPLVTQKYYVIVVFSTAGEFIFVLVNLTYVGSQVGVLYVWLYVHFKCVNQI